MLRELPEPVHVLQVHPHRIHTLDVSRGGSGHQGRAGVEQVARFALAPQGKAQLAAEILRAEHEAR